MKKVDRISLGALPASAKSIRLYTIKSCYIITPVAIMLLPIITTPLSVFATLVPFANFNINDTSKSTAETSSTEAHCCFEARCL
jgi:hypothetical protein